MMLPTVRLLQMYKSSVYLGGQGLRDTVVHNVHTRNAFSKLWLQVGFDKHSKILFELTAYWTIIKSDSDNISCNFFIF